MANCIQEIWKEVPLFEGCYEVSNAGEIRTMQREIMVPTGKSDRFFKRVIKENILNQLVAKNGYSYVTMSVNGKHKTATVHRLVASAHIPNPNNFPEVNHKDGNKQNNCVENLEWCTAKENSIHKVSVLGIGKGETHPSVKLTTDQVRMIRTHKRRSKYYAELFGVSLGTIESVKRFQNWRDVI